MTELFSDMRMLELKKMILIPPYDCFYTQELRELVTKRYKEDFVIFDY